MRFCYSLLGYLLLPLLFLRLLWRSVRVPAYRQRWRERLGYYGTCQPPRSPCVVFHAVSVGEVHAAQPLIEAFRAARPDFGIVLTTTTPTGSDRVRALFGDSVTHIYLPWDLPGPVHRFLGFCKPSLVVLMETELWPNLLAGCRRQGCSAVLVNARMSEKSMRGYKRLGFMTHEMLGALRAVAAQSADDARRLAALGFPATRIEITGSLKFDVRLDQDKIARGRAYRKALDNRPVWIAASTREGEDQKVLKAHALARRENPDLLLVLVPRHPERFALAAQLSVAMGMPTLRYSEGGSPGPDTSVLVGDTMGDLAFYYALADVAFVGGSLVNTGCQNVIEPAALGLPVLTGPSRFNFQAISDAMLKAGALFEVNDEQGLAGMAGCLLADRKMREASVKAALAVAAANQGATARVCTLVLDNLPIP